MCLDLCQLDLIERKCLLKDKMRNYYFFVMILFEILSSFKKIVAKTVSKLKAVVRKK